MRRLVLVACALAWLPAAGARAQVPTPSNDPFFAVPSGIDRVPDGTILASRQVQAVSGGAPMPARAWQVKYKTTDNLGHPTATVTTVMVPDAAWSGPGPRPLVSYQTAEDGVDTKCAPSYALTAGPQALGTNSESETGIMRQALERGWAVAAPDYEGPESQFIGLRMSAHGVLDGLRAARAFKPAGVAPDARLALWGYSGGALATAWASQLQSELAPELKLSGVALGGVVADIKATFRAFDGGPVGGALPMALSGVDRSYPEENVLQYLNAAGRDTVAASSHDCIGDAAMRYPGWSSKDYEARPGVLDEPRPTAFIASISPATMSSVPTGPVYMYTSRSDELALVDPMLRLAARYCAAGVPVQTTTDPPGEHVVAVVTGAPGAMDYLGDRFAGKAAPNACAPGSRKATAAAKVRYRLRARPATARHGRRTRFTFAAGRTVATAVVRVR